MRGARTLPTIHQASAASCSTAARPPGWHWRRQGASYYHKHTHIYKKAGVSFQILHPLKDADLRRLTLGLVPDLGSAVVRKDLLEVCERLHDRRRALDVGVIDHDVTCWRSDRVRE